VIDNDLPMKNGRVNVVRPFFAGAVVGRWERAVEIIVLCEMDTCSPVCPTYRKDYLLDVTGEVTVEVGIFDFRFIVLRMADISEEVPIEVVVR
jgi:hypothetical protein